MPTVAPVERPPSEDWEDGTGVGLFEVIGLAEFDGEGTAVGVFEAAVDVKYTPTAV